MRSEVQRRSAVQVWLEDRKGPLGQAQSQSQTRTQTDAVVTDWVPGVGGEFPVRNRYRYLLVTLGQDFTLAGVQFRGRSPSASFVRLATASTDRR